MIGKARRMRKSRFSEEQIRLAVQQAEAGVDVTKICRKYGVSATTFYRWRQKYGSLSRSGLQELKELQRENSRLKKIVADPTLDKQIPRDAIKSHRAGGACARASGRVRCCRILRITTGSRMNATMRIVPPQRQRCGSTSNTLAINFAHSRRRSRCDGVERSGASWSGEGRAPAPRVRLA